MKRKIGFVGLGAMGRPMAVTLVGQGHDVAGFDLDPDAVAVFREAGGRPADSAADAARGAEVLVVMVVNAAQAEAVLFEAGALAATVPDAVVILTATCSPSSAAALALRVETQGRRFVDAPVSGGVKGATGGSLTIMAAAPAATFEAVRPILAAMGSKLFHVGEAAGQGAAVKTLNQLMCGVHIAVAAEALSLAAKMGVDRSVVLEILGGSAASSWMLQDRGPRMLESDPAVASAVDIFVKDLGIVVEAGGAAKAAVPLASAALQIFVAASARGAGKADDSQVVRVYDMLNGTG